MERERESDETGETELPWRWHDPERDVFISLSSALVYDDVNVIRESLSSWAKAAVKYVNNTHTWTETRVLARPLVHVALASDWHT